MEKAWRTLCLLFCMLFLFDTGTAEQQDGSSLKDLTKELRSKLLGHGGNDGRSSRGLEDESSHLEILYNILDKIERFSCDKTTFAIEESLADLTKNMNTMKNDILGQIIKIKEDSDFKVDVSDLFQRVVAMETTVNDIKQELQSQAEQLEGVVGTTYIRWGKERCPGDDAEEVYSGFAGGSYYNHEGAAASMVCLPKDPIYKKYDDSLQNGGLMYGSKYGDRAGGSNRESTIVGKNNHEKDVPCVVCSVKKRSTLMIPGRSECYPGWKMEYWGYLMSGRYAFKASTNYYCVDADQDGIIGRGNNDNGYLLYFVEGRCGILPCPPYVDGRELTCVVCTK